MWTANHFAWNDEDGMRALVARHGFGLLLSQGPDGPVVSHLPMVLDGGLLIGHVARPNQHGALFDAKTPALAVFRGAHGYVSPRFYTSRDNVPTWNYEAVHLEGVPHAVTEEARILDILARLSAAYEQAAEQPWTLADVSPSKLSGLLRGIVAFEMPITRWIGKRKLSQNRPPEDREGVMENLSASPRQADRDLARVMRQSVNPPV